MQQYTTKELKFNASTKENSQPMSEKRQMIIFDKGAEVKKEERDKELAKELKKINDMLVSTSF